MKKKRDGMQVSATRLETVLRVRQMQVKKTEKELAQIARTKEQEQGELDRLHERKEDAMSDVIRTAKARAREVVTKRAFVDTISGNIKHQERKIHEIGQAEDAKRSQLLEQSKSERMVEKLDAKLREEEEKRIEKRTQRVIDALAQRSKAEG